MSLPRYAKKRDGVEKEVFDALRQCGFSVEPMDTPCDALVGFRRRCWLIEVKSGSKGYGKDLNANQRRFAEAWRGPEIVILRSAQEAIDWCVMVSQEAA